MRKKAILYARVSGDDRKYATSGIESQLADCKKYAEQQGYEIVGEHFETPDKATSGADWLPEIENILTLAYDGAFDVLIVREVDRLARNRFKQMSIENTIEGLGLRVEYVIGQFKDSAEGRLLRGVMSDFAEYEREKTLQRTKRGTMRAVMAGNVVIGGSNAPFGYEIVEVRGKRTLQINESEAEIVRLIFRLYAHENNTLLGICRYLDKHNVPTPSKGQNHLARKVRKGWSTGTMSGILNNETYVGRWYYGKKKNVKEPNGKIKQVKQPRSKWLLIEVPPIIDEETFNLVQKRRKQNKRCRDQKKSYPYPLGGIMKCGHCGSGMIGITRKHNETPYRYYRCSTRHLTSRYEKTCDMPTLKTIKIDTLIWQWVQEILLNPGRLHKAWEQHEQQRLDELQPLVKMIEINTHKLTELHKEKKRLVKAYTSGVFSLDDVDEEKIRIESEIANLTQAIAELKADIQPRMPNAKDIETIERYARQIQEGVDLASADPTVQREIYNLLQMEITLNYVSEEGEAGKDGHHWADFYCILGKESLSTSFTTSHQSETAPTIATVDAPAPSAEDGLVTAERLSRETHVKTVFGSIYSLIN